MQKQEFTVCITVQSENGWYCVQESVEKKVSAYFCNKSQS